jgi:hypothetical protein
LAEPQPTPRCPRRPILASPSPPPDCQPSPALRACPANPSLWQASKPCLRHRAAIPLHSLSPPTQANPARPLPFQPLGPIPSSNPQPTVRSRTPSTPLVSSQGPLQLNPGLRTPSFGVSQGSTPGRVDPLDTFVESVEDEMEWEGDVSIAELAKKSPEAVLCHISRLYELVEILGRHRCSNRDAVERRGFAVREKKFCVLSLIFKMECLDCGECLSWRSSEMEAERSSFEMMARTISAFLLTGLPYEQHRALFACELTYQELYKSGEFHVCSD